MCGRYAYSDDPDAVSEEFSVVKILPTREELAGFHNLAPTMKAPIVFNDNGVRTLALFQWSLIPPWSKDGTIPKIVGEDGVERQMSTFNAKAETVDVARSYKASFKSRRCIVPARGFYEWQGKKSPKQPYYIHRRDNRPLGFAGLWSRWESKDGTKVIPSFTIITTDPNYMMEKIHHRMPVILDLNDYEAWLDPNNQDTVALKKLLCPCPEEWLIAHKIESQKALPGVASAATMDSTTTAVLDSPSKPKRQRKPKPDDDPTEFLF